MPFMTLIIALQVGMVGPVLPEPRKDLRTKFTEKKCNDSAPGEIVVCARNIEKDSQRLDNITPPSEEQLTQDESGLFRLKKEDLEISGGGPKGTTGVGLKIKL